MPKPPPVQRVSRDPHAVLTVRRNAPPPCWFEPDLGVKRGGPAMNDPNLKFMFDLAGRKRISMSLVSDNGMAV